MLEKLLQPEIEDLIRNREFKELRQTLEEWPATEIATLIEELVAPEDVIVFRLLPREIAADAFEFLSHEKQLELVEALAGKEHRLAELLNDLAPDDRTAMLEELPGPVVQRLLNLLSAEELKIAIALLGYPEESIGRLMTPEYVAVRPGWTVARALEHIRRHGRDSETLNVIYVVDASWHLIDDLRLIRASRS
jgi:magnesium transporter